MGRDGRQYVAVMATGGGGYLGGGLSNSLVAFALPDVPREPLPTSVAAAVASAVVNNDVRKPGANASAVLPKGGAKALVEKTCGTSCHTMGVLASQRTDEKGWNAIVQNMVARGAQASDEQVKVIVNYLTKNFGR
jgi:cytochrome c5